jgi:serine/threonine/tyrosine-interacting protein
MKCLALFRAFSTMKILQDDNKPVEVIENIYIGSFAAAENKDALQETKISHIVCAATNLKQNFPDDFKYLKLDLLDSPDCNIKQYFLTSCEFIHSCLEAGGRVFVHWYIIC